MIYDPTKDFMPFRYLSPTAGAPRTGYIATTIHLRTLDVLIGEDTCEFVFTREELNNMDRGTLTFRAKDNGGAIVVQKCSVSGLKMVIKLERRVIQFGKVQVEWATNAMNYSF